MCGIAGTLAGSDGPEIDLERLRRAADQMRHRGPDDADVWSQGGIGLAHTRLAIIDRAEGDQPMFSADGRYGVVFNGEIYNHRDLRKELEKHGYELKTRCDTEVLLYLFDWLGAGMVERLRGMFAFCVVDRKFGTALIARDRLGKKPFYFAEHEGGLSFASTLDALGELLPTSLTIDPDALARYLLMQYVPSPTSPYQEARKLAPGHLGTWSVEEGLRTQAYWKPPMRAGDVREGFPRPASEEVRARIAEAVDLRLESEVPLGVFLSGGLDSSVVVAELARGGSPPATFSMGFRSASFDETSYAEAVARHFGTTHTRLVADEDVPGLFEDFTRSYDEPFADSSALATLAVAKAASEHVTVVLTGDGGDEVFGGYERYVWYRKVARLRSSLGPLAALGGSALRSVGRTSKVSRLEKAGLLISEPWAGYRDMMLHYRPPDIGWLLRPEVLDGVVVDEAVEHLDHLWSRAPGPASTLMWIDEQTYLPDDLLTKMDRATMAYSIEARSPLLDHVLIEWVSTLPDALLFEGSQGKAVMREAYRDVLPSEVLTRRKMGFGVPIASWMRNELRPQVEELLLSGDGPLWDWFQRESVTTLVQRFLDGGPVADTKIWNLLALSGWMRARSIG